MYKRIVIKLSGEALGNDHSLYDDTVIDSLVKDIKDTLESGVQICLALGGGNIWRGQQGKNIDPPKADQMGMLATVINSMYLSERLIASGVGAVVFTPFSVGTFTTQFSKELAIECLEQGKVAIFGGGTGHPFFSTDTIPALRACELNCDCVLFAKNINGIYDKDPNIHTDAIRYETLTYRDIITKNLQAIDIAAMVLCEKHNIPSIVFSLKEPGSIKISAHSKGKSLTIGTTIKGSQ